MQSRYYDPEIGRFLNADIFVSTGQGLLGNNMFAYCRNNPTSRIDASGFLDNKITEKYDDDVEVAPLENELGGGGSGGISFDAQQALLDGTLTYSYLNSEALLPRQGSVAGNPKAPPVDAGKQGKHVIGHNNYNSSKSSWPKRQNGVKQTQEAWTNGVQDYRKSNQQVRIGMASDGTIVRVHMGENGWIHGYPFFPYWSYVE